MLKAGSPRRAQNPPSSKPRSLRMSPLNRSVIAKVPEYGVALAYGTRGWLATAMVERVVP